MNPNNQSPDSYTMPNEDEMFAAISARDARRDGQFIFGVVTTGVYCKPSCSARPALRENIRFFTNPKAAAKAGFRACQKCDPDNAAADKQRLIEIARHIEANASDSLTLDALASRTNLSPMRLQKKFKALFGVSPKQYQDGLRLGQFKSALKDGVSVTDAVYAAGFGSPSRVYGDKLNSLGMTPAAYRSGAHGEEIRFAVRDSVLGPILMAATEKGVCFAQFGDSESALLHQLEDEFPKATIKRSSGEHGRQLDKWMKALDEYMNANAPRPEVPLDLRGTAFQMLVWRFLLGTEDGEIISYSELANGIGRPKAVRAAASACGANRISMLVPCHRVLRGDGSMGGYRWGVDRKRVLLDVERRRQGSG